MVVKYFLNRKLWLVHIPKHKYIIELYNHKYQLEEIEPPCNDIKLIAEFSSLGDALEIMLRREMKECEEIL